MTAPAHQKETASRMVDKLLSSSVPWRVALQGTQSPQETPLPDAFKDLPVASEELPVEIPEVEIQDPEVDTALQEAEEIITLAEQHVSTLPTPEVAEQVVPESVPEPEVVESTPPVEENSTPQEAPVEAFVQQTQEADSISPDINEGVEAFVAKSEADGTTPEQAVHELVKQAKQNDPTQEIKVMLLTQTRSEYEAAKKMNKKQGGSWLRVLNDKLIKAWRLLGKLAAFQPEEKQNSA